jgi:hypothetical protein
MELVRPEAVGASALLKRGWMTPPEAQEWMPGDRVEYQGQRATIMQTEVTALTRSSIRATFRVKTDDGKTHHVIDYRLLTLVPTA